jgi:KDO2-lipid IV(A) lauroyltransferase
MKGTLATARDWFVDRAYALGWALACRVPESWARSAFLLAGDIAWRRQGRGVQRLEANLRRVVGPQASGKELRALSRAGMRSYARYWMEVFRLPVISRERILAGTVSNGGEQAAFAQLAAGRGVVFALPHTGNWEVAGAWIIARGAGKFTTVAERLKPDAVFEKFLAFRESLGMEVLPTTGGPHPFGVMAQRLRAGKLVCIVADRDLSDTGVEVDFFGEKALLPAGPAALAVQTGAALMPVSCWFVGEDEWAAHVHDEIPAPETGTRKEKVAVMTQAMASVFEEAIREHPDNWHMLQKVFVADLDPARLARSRARAEEKSP